MTSSVDYDVIIVGGRVAGSITATLLAEYGHGVLVLERATFPSDTLSTHFFRAPALRAFASIGVVDEVVSSAPRLSVNYNVIDGIVFPEAVDRPADYPYYLCVRRVTLDEILVRRAQACADVDYREAAVVNSLLREGGRVVGARWKEGGEIHESKARFVVGADGVRSFVAKQVGPVAENEEPVNRAMYYAYYQGIPPMKGPAAEFHYRGNSLAYCFPCDNELTLVAVSVPIERFTEFKRDPEGMLAAEVATMADLAPRFEFGIREGPVRGTGSIPGYLRNPYGEGWALVGDAAMVMDPWSGQGIDQGSTHAVMLARHLDRYLSGKANWDSAMESYHQERVDYSMKAYRRTCQFSRDLRPMTQMALAKRGLA